MLVRQVTYDIATGETTERWVEDSTVLTVQQAQAIDAVEAQAVTNESAIRTQAEQAIANLGAYRDLTNPTNAQTIAAVKLLCRVAIGLIRLQLRKFDGTD